MIKFRIKKVNTKKDLQEALKIREIVFIKGQNVPVKRERDGLEHKCVHFLVLYKNRYIGTGRAFLLNKKEAKFERMAVLKEYRGKGIGLR
ncbi:MAG: GNAT family N-acetyltransferase, partial [Nanoarchaeota archaeon]|nr:GNAT family N-acetyltransferase [Nanoarchaeota archaeon]